MLSEVKTHKFVLGEILRSVEAENIKFNLSEKGFDVVNVCRLTRKTGKGKMDMPLVLIELPRNAAIKNIHHFSDVMSLGIKVEQLGL